MRCFYHSKNIISYISRSTSYYFFVTYITKQHSELPESTDRFKKTKVRMGYRICCSEAKYELNVANAIWNGRNWHNSVTRNLIKMGSITIFCYDDNLSIFILCMLMDDRSICEKK